MKKSSKILLTAVCLCMMIFFTGGQSVKAADKSYGVFIGSSSEDLSKMAGYKTIILDAAYFTAEDIASLKAQGSVVYSYLNVGSLENFRDYYDQFSAYTLGAYENWEDEEWMDVSNPDWQWYLSNVVAASYIEKGVDGFFLDNLSVYDEYQTPEVYQGLKKILHRIKKLGKPVIVNGGEGFLRKYMKHYKDFSKILDGINEESVYTGYNFDTNKMILQSKEERKRKIKYLRKCEKKGAEIYVIEYVQKDSIKKKLKKFYKKQGWKVYLADSISLD